MLQGKCTSRNPSLSIEFVESIHSSAILYVITSMAFLLDGIPMPDGVPMYDGVPMSDGVPMLDGVPMPDGDT